MKYVLNSQKGSTINHPAAGKLEGGKAYLVSDEVANQLKHIISIIIFDEVIKNDSDIGTS